jgi:uncharacterized protein (TIGR03435 family)
MRDEDLDQDNLWRCGDRLTLIKPYAGQSILTPSPDAPSIFVAIQDLGLKLEPRRAPVEILVVYSADEPLPD